MDELKPRGTPLTGPCFYGTFEQRRAIEGWEAAGWTFLHWTEVPRIMALMEGPAGVLHYIDDKGWAWLEPRCGRALVPLEDWPNRAILEDQQPLKP